MKKRVTAALLTVAVLLLQGMPVAAQEYTTEGTAECEISCQVASSYTVSIPASVSLSYSQETGTVSGTYQIGVKGDLLLNQMVKVVPTQLTDRLGEGLNGEYHYGKLTGESTSTSLSVTVKQEKIQWIPKGTTPALPLKAERCIEISDSDFVYVEGTITSREPEAADTYTGTLVFQFGVEEYTRQQ